MNKKYKKKVQEEILLVISEPGLMQNKNQKHVKKYK